MISSKTSPAVLTALVLAMLPAIAVADGHWLFGGSVGTASIDEAVDGFRFDADSTSYRVYGGYQFNDYFALEGGYMDLGTFDEQIQQNGTAIPISADADGFTFAARGSVPLGEKFALHGTIGSFFWDGANEIAGINSNVSDSNIFFGAAASFDVTTNVSLRAEATQYELDGVNSEVFALGFQLNFR